MPRRFWRRPPRSSLLVAPARRRSGDACRSGPRALTRYVSRPFHRLRRCRRALGRSKGVLFVPGLRAGVVCSVHVWIAGGRGRRDGGILAAGASGLGAAARYPACRARDCGVGGARPARGAAPALRRGDAMPPDLRPTYGLLRPLRAARRRSDRGCRGRVTGTAADARDAVGADAAAARRSGWERPARSVSTRGRGLLSTVGRAGGRTGRQKRRPSSPNFPPTRTDTKVHLRRAFWCRKRQGDCLSRG